MTEQKRPTLTIRRKSKIFVNPRHANTPDRSPKPTKQPSETAPKQVKEPKPKQVPTMARNREKKLRQGQETIASLMAHWPQLFSLEHPKPLKIGIATDILADIKARELEITRAKASAALMFYTQTSVYQQAVHSGGSRFDLSGQPCDEITAQQQRDHALKQLEKWRAEAESAASPCAESTP